MSYAIKIENLSKQYRLGLVGTGTLSHDLKRKWALMRGKEDPYLKIGETNDRSVKGNSDYVWALKDINFEVKPGEVLGIIGKNGAGKSTLLKILSKVTGPTTGTIKYKGRIGSLLEVGTGFHQELTGRENIYLNGAILGMRKVEIDNKLDEIVDFSGVERYIDTPVKRYSSGMMVRLGFAVAAFLEPEILVVDEVLAVGDAEFQKKAIGKMQDVSKVEGRTILFVSHNMNSIRNICNRAILLSNGKIIFDDINVLNVIEEYQSNASKKKLYWINKNNQFINNYFIPQEMCLEVNGYKSKNNNISKDNNCNVVIEGDLLKANEFLQIGYAVFYMGDMLYYSTILDSNSKTELQRGRYKFKVPFLTKELNLGQYQIKVICALYRKRWLISPFENNSPSIEVNLSQIGFDTLYWIKKREGLIAPYLKWEIIKLG